MMPVAKGKRHTRWQILFYSLVLFPVGLLPVFLGFGGPLTGAASLCFGGWLIWQSTAVLRETDEAREPAARKLFGVSIVYLFALFAALIGEHLIGLKPLIGTWI
jgi:protoheme IX farnesyltransferase